MPTDLLVDSNSLYARAWYATKGVPYQTVIATLQMSLVCINPRRVGEKIDRIMFCWDAGQKLAKEREPRPKAYEDTKEHVAACLEGIYGANNVRIAPHEADDIIATAATQSQSDHVIIATGDKDLHQLNDSKISIFDIATKGMVGRREIVSRWHIKRPCQLAIALAIQGDSSDNIPGIKGWGPKKVQALFESVTPEMEFEDALGVVVEQIPKTKHEEFLTALDLTLLHCDIPGVPEPSVLALCDPTMLEQQSLGELTAHYRQVYNEYAGIDSEASLTRRVDALMKMIDER